MGKLSYTATVSLDGYVADESGDFQWSAPSDEVFAVHLERVRRISTEVLGRKTYALMEYWEDPAQQEGFSADESKFACYWREVDKVVVSSTLTARALRSQHARLLPELSLATLREIVDHAPGLVEIFGPRTAAPAIRAGMVDEFHLFVAPTVVGGGLRALPDGVRLDLRLLEHRIFDSGVTYLRYAPR